MTRFGVLRAVKELDPNIPVIVMTAYGSIEDAVAAMKVGVALDFLARVRSISSTLRVSSDSDFPSTRSPSTRPICCCW